MAVKPIPEQYHSLTPYLVIKGAAAAIDYYKKVFGATERGRMDAPGGKIGHAELRSATRRSCSPTSSPRWATAARRRSAARP